MKLSELPIGSSATVRDFPRSGATFVRLREMGLLAGTKVTLIRTAPLGDPLEIKLRGYHLSLRKTEAELIEVTPETAASS
jgi:ferrous iron transport protein A